MYFFRLPCVFLLNRAQFRKKRELYQGRDKHETIVNITQSGGEGT